MTKTTVSKKIEYNGKTLSVQDGIKSYRALELLTEFNVGDDIYTIVWTNVLN
jgi:hypothetical protein